MDLAKDRGSQSCVQNEAVRVLAIPTGCDDRVVLGNIHLELKGRVGSQTEIQTDPPPRSGPAEMRMLEGDLRRILTPIRHARDIRLHHWAVRLALSHWAARRLLAVDRT